MDVLVSGSTGLVGSSLVSALRYEGHRVIRLTRSQDAGDDAVRWDPSAGKIDADRLEGIDAVVHLAGENLVGRWTSNKKARIRNSRVQGTRLLAETLAGLASPPGVMVSASATGYYGDRGDELLREESAPGTNFLAEVCQKWEAAANPVREARIRVVHPRFGIVLSPQGGALRVTLPIFKVGGGGRIGSGRQYWPWVAIDDVVGSILHALKTDSLEGPVNVSVPDPPTNAQYTTTLGRVLNRPTVFPLPAPIARLMLGQLADELLLASQRVEPAGLKESGYEYRYPELDGALRHLLER
ncbi:MAG TPA: TIGR01777 family oxidoreductase [Rubrobacteraceae bacterium]|nr:TIGR01777 family oxidoreductase [Rubrobacteraceae bacterium]